MNWISDNPLDIPIAPTPGHLFSCVGAFLFLTTTARHTPIHPYTHIISFFHFSFPQFFQIKCKQFAFFLVTLQMHCIMCQNEPSAYVGIAQTLRWVRVALQDIVGRKRYGIGFGSDSKARKSLPMTIGNNSLNRKRRGYACMGVSVCEYFNEWGNCGRDAWASEYEQRVRFLYVPTTNYKYFD